MAIGPRRAGFYVSVLAIGFVVGGFLSALMDRFLPQWRTDRDKLALTPLANEDWAY